MDPSAVPVDRSAQGGRGPGGQDRARLCTHGQVLKSQGLDREEVVSAREIEIRDAIDRAKRIEEETGVRVPWEYFAGLSPSVNAAAIRQPGDGDGQEKPEEPEEPEEETDREVEPEEVPEEEAAVHG